MTLDKVTFDTSYVKMSIEQTVDRSYATMSIEKITVDKSYVIRTIPVEKIYIIMTVGKVTVGTLYGKVSVEGYLSRGHTL